MDLIAKINGITYKPFLTRSLKTYEFVNFENAFERDSAFLLKLKSEEKIAISWWVSPKRTRSYPYARVYDTLGFQGKRVTIIPVFKDEGKDGDRDFLQWDTISLMSLLGIYTIISYYTSAEKNNRFMNKITNQKFNINQIKEEIEKLLTYQSDALHWNLCQIDNIGDLVQKAFDAYDKIAQNTGIILHSRKSALKRIEKLKLGKEEFMFFSRNLASQAQKRETVTIQPKEQTIGNKAKITIQNYLGGFYYFTCDEVYTHNNGIWLIEAKHSKQNLLPSLEDIKDGLLKMILFTNLTEVKIGNKYFHHTSILKLSTCLNISTNYLSKNQIRILKLLLNESQQNNFRVLIQGKDGKNIELEKFLANNCH